MALYKALTTRRGHAASVKRQSRQRLRRERRYRRNRSVRFYRHLARTGSAFPRLPRRFAPRNDTSGSAAVHQCPPAVEWLCTRRSLPARGTPHPQGGKAANGCAVTAATVKFGSACGRRWLVRAATASPRLPRRFAPRNDNLGECRGAPAPLHGLIPLYKALATRKGHAASVRRQSRQRLRRERRYSQIWQRVRSAMACTGCNCLPEIATSLCSSQ